MDIKPGGGVGLVARHAGGGIVGDDGEGVAFVVHHIDKTADAGVGEGGIADDGHRFFAKVASARFFQPQCHADGRPHAHHAVHGGKRRQSAQCVAADVGCHGESHFPQNPEQAAVRAAGT